VVFRENVEMSEEKNNTKRTQKQRRITRNNSIEKII
jgi:hypothetical protein